MTPHHGQQLHNESSPVIKVHGQHGRGGQSPDMSNSQHDDDAVEVAIINKQVENEDDRFRRDGDFTVGAAGTLDVTEPETRELGDTGGYASSDYS